ncbi:MAG: stage II sporulation protein P [Bacilli bacterium]|nr:stage II sporulation protein P [Bacilli bacterium]
MRKRFKGKKNNKKHYFIKVIITAIFIYLIYQTVLYLNISSKLVNGNDEFIKAMLNDTNHHLLYEKKANNIINKIISTVSKIDLTKPTTFLKDTIVFEETDTKGNTININYVENPLVEEDNPRVYIYNTHQSEEYSSDGLEGYNITPNVMMASYLLADILKDLGISAIVEDTDITELLNLNNWNYNQSYKASRLFIEDTLDKYGDFDLIIDLHRDAITKENGTVTIDGKDYAKILFVVGTSNENYEKNQEVVNNLNSIINNKYPGLSRGILGRKGVTTKGCYNQDLDSKMILLEVGGNENTIGDITNTITAMANVITEYLGES